MFRDSPELELRWGPTAWRVLRGWKRCSEWEKLANGRGWVDLVDLLWILSLLERSLELVQLVGRKCRSGSVTMKISLTVCDDCNWVWLSIDRNTKSFAFDLPSNLSRPRHVIRVMIAWISVAHHRQVIIVVNVNSHFVSCIDFDWILVICN